MTKVISISDKAYEELKKLKAEKSFSEIILSVLKKRSNERFLSSIGSWKMSDEEAEKLKKRVYEERKIGSRRFK